MTVHIPFIRICRNKDTLNFITLVQIFALLFACLCIFLCSCSSADANDTDGAPYTEPSSVAAASFNPANAKKVGIGYVDLSTASSGYVGASAVSNVKCKLQVTHSGESYNYDLPGDGTPIIVPINMGDGTYSFRVMQNSSGNNYIETGATSTDVVLDSQFEPFLHPDVFCNYTPDSPVVKKAYDLAANSTNEGDVVKAVYKWIADNITYDKSKAAELANATGYVPNPDETLESGTGICFDYASLAAAMFRSLGIPCQIVTGYVEPNNLYHAWNMIYINGQWISAEISVVADEWCRIDLTFAAASGDNSEYVGNGVDYTDRYIY